MMSTPIINIDEQHTCIEIISINKTFQSFYIGRLIHIMDSSHGITFQIYIKESF